jgi:hypothetical protein
MNGIVYFVSTLPHWTTGERIRRFRLFDAEVNASTDELLSPKSRVCEALMAAAVEAHPDWQGCPSGRGWIGPYVPKGNHPEHDPDSLTAWFEWTYPAEAARITAEVLAN